MNRDDLPTLRLMTLRRLLSGVPPPLVFQTSTEVATVAAALRDTRGAVAVLIDHDCVLRGTLQLEDLGAVDGHAHAGAVMATATPVLEPESDIESARVSMRTHECHCVLVVAASGELLGVLTERDLARAA